MDIKEILPYVLECAHYNIVNVTKVPTKDLGEYINVANFI